MNIIFFGNTKYSVIDAEALHKHFGLTAVVTIPDKEIKKNIVQSPVKTFALANNIPVIEAEKLTLSIIDQIKQLHPDFLVVADYRLIIPQELLRVPKFAPLNIHHSLLPKYRGPSPVPSTLLAGEKKTGVTIIIMNDKVDDGDIVAQKEYTIQPEDTSETLLTKLNQLGSQAVIEVIEHFNEIKPIKQDESQASFTNYMEKQHGYIDTANPPTPEKLDLMMRAYHPWPGVWSTVKLRDKEVRIKFSPAPVGAKHLPAGRKGLLPLIQVEGKKPQTIKDFLNGYPEATQWLATIM
ncbi:MAG TPA: methionyl-tRNA formyltransferase [Candidatus Saccharimonadales bacterium]|nr:methionyl-tRNA formyltransferase [Candidatus Saccharimonadales bacterium]